MEKVPIYLRWFLLRISRHSGEEGFFVKRFEGMEREKMLIETLMLKDLYRRELILLPEKRLEKVYDPLIYSPAPGVTVHRATTEHRIPYPAEFWLAPAGKYIWTESIVGIVGSLVWTSAIAVLGGFIGGLIG
jgi:hypothetical protein